MKLKRNIDIFIAFKKNQSSIKNIQFIVRR